MMKKQFTTIFLCLLLPTCAFSEIIKEPGYVYIASFNVYKLGSVDSKYLSIDDDMGDEVVPTGIPDRIKNLSNVLSVGAFDLIALQEVTFGPRGEAAVSDLIKDLKDRYSLDYEALHSEHIGRGLVAEMITFLYQPNVVSPEIVSGTTSFTKLIPIDGRDLAQTQWTADNFDFTLISAHLAWGNEDDRIDGYQKLNEIFESPLSFSNDIDVLIIGDFNRFGDDQEAVKKLEFNGNFIAPNVTIFDPDFNQRKEVSTTSISGKGIPGNNPQLVSTTVAKNKFVYDMFLMTTDVAEELPSLEYGTDWGIIHFDEPDGVGFQSGADELSHNELKEAYSDHRPLWFRFKTDQAANFDGDTSARSKYVATRTGRKFHLPHCHTIKNRGTPKGFDTLDEAKLEHSACKVCKPDQT